MQTLTRTFNLILIVILLGMIFTALGCSKTDDSGQTVGQKLDQSLDKGNAVANQAGRDIENAARQADRKIQQGANKAEDALRDSVAAARDKSGEVPSVVDDSAITASVKAEMLKDPALSVLQVNVSTTKGEVTLQGKVANAATRRHAEEVAQAVSGVQKVNNELQVAASDKVPGAA